MAKTPADRFATAHAFVEALTTTGGVDRAPRGTEAQAAPPRNRRPIAVAAAVAGVGLLAAGGWLVASSGAPVTEFDAEGTRIAVFPASVAGVDTTGLGVGFGELLYRALDGAGELRGVDPNALFPQLARETSDQTDLATARSAGQSLGAELFVLSRIVRIGDQLDIRSSLFDGRRSGPLAMADAQGPEEELAQLAERVAWGVVSEYRAADAKRTDISVVRPRTYRALKAYLRGIRAMQRDGFHAAADAFREAVEEDSTFGLAWYQLSVAQGWLSAPGAQESTERAMRYRETLPAPERLFVEVDQTFLNGDLERADSLETRLLGRYPTHAESWRLRGRTLRFYNWRRGRSVAEARAPMERALELDPDHLPAIWGLMMIAANDGKLAEADSLGPRWLALSPHAAWADVLPVFGALRDEAAFRDFARSAVALRDGALYDAASFAATFARDFDRAAQLTAVLTDSLARSARTQATAHLRMAHLATAGGRLRDGGEHFTHAERIAGGPAVALRAMLTVSSPLDIRDGELRFLLDRLATWDGETGAFRFASPFSVPAELAPHFRSYVLGLLHARLGEDSLALARADALDRAEAPHDSAGMLHDAARDIRAVAAMRRGDPRGALVALERQMFNVRWAQVWFGSLFHSRAFSRYLRAEAHYRLGRYRDALRWFESVESNGGVIAYFAPSHLRRAQIHERLGEIDRAEEQYAAFERLWARADGGQVEMARRGDGAWLTPER